jgi:hypothetical protein
MPEQRNVSTGSPYEPHRRVPRGSIGGANAVAAAAPLGPDGKPWSEQW